MAHHDIIVGDLGRRGTLRYFDAFSEAERDYLADSLETDTFYDEYRQIRYTVVGSLPEIKRELLPDKLSEIDDSVLVGVEGGQSPLELLPEIIRILAPTINAAVAQGAQRMRIIIPCNTMYLVSKGISSILLNGKALMNFAHEHGLFGPEIGQLAETLENISIESPSVVEGVVSELDESGVDRVLLAASAAAESAYQKLIAKDFDHIECIPWLPPGIASFSDLLQRAIQEKPIPEDTAYDAGSEALLSACTDIPIPGTLDSTELFARRMVRSAYQHIELT